MQALTLPAHRGWRWLAEGYAIYSKRRLALPTLVVAYLIITLTLSAIPIVGQFLAPLLIPVFSVSMMNACRLIERGDAFPPQILFSGLYRNARTLLVLGITYIVCYLLIIGATALIDGGVIFRYVINGQTLAHQPPGAEVSLSATVLGAVLLLQLAMAYWFAPVLAAWSDLPAAKSLFFSYVACLRNWRAFLVYFAALILACTLSLVLAVALLGTLFPTSEKVWAVGLSSLFMVVLMPTLYASFYASYRDIFVVIDENV